MCLGEITQLPVIELDMVFWRPGIAATPRDQWVIVQEKHVAEDGWIMDGELGPYDGVDRSWAPNRRCSRPAHRARDPHSA
jgi:hypothetical protein